MRTLLNIFLRIYNSLLSKYKSRVLSGFDTKFTLSSLFYITYFILYIKMTRLKIIVIPNYDFLVLTPLSLFWQKYVIGQVQPTTPRLTKTRTIFFIYLSLIEQSFTFYSSIYKHKVPQKLFRTHNFEVNNKFLTIDPTLFLSIFFLKKMNIDLNN